MVNRNLRGGRAVPPAHDQSGPGLSAGLATGQRTVWPLPMAGFSVRTKCGIGLECFKHSSLDVAVKQTLLHGLFPAVRAEVLRLLFTNRGQELYTRELARLSFLALRTIQDELAKLGAANLVLSRTNGYQRFYRANPKHPLHAALTEIVRKGAAHAKPNPRALRSRRSPRAKRT